MSQWVMQGVDHTRQKVLSGFVYRWKFFNYGLFDTPKIDVVI